MFTSVIPKLEVVLQRTLRISSCETNKFTENTKKIVGLLPYNKVCSPKKTQSHLQVSSLNTTVFVFQKPNKESR